MKEGDRGGEVWVLAKRWVKRKKEGEEMGRNKARGWESKVEGE